MKRDRPDIHHVKLVRALLHRKDYVPAKFRGEVTALEVYWEMNRTIPREAIARIRELLAMASKHIPGPALAQPASPVLRS